MTIDKHDPAIAVFDLFVGVDFLDANFASLSVS